ncbi:hypothetical protein AIOL_003783 [Candidatus Rhodobacter oscarellae]|uniref:Transmembrane protein n=1 Tax=Candidatus Rhodobacter oscarellae TaxID=1675527 RepID=A0A0J9GZA2_9RHOB|nr:hypothetical protein [Candidatus Rhodobacter lobularis]KMW58803.1 hypothetical protein AIOL_003783 [Candidatus Rhodobacter lobularis]
MRGINSLVDVSGYLLMLSGLMHLVAFAWSGLSYGVYGFLPVGVALVVIGYALQRTEWRWLAWIAYLVIGIAVSFVIRDFYVTSGAPSWWFSAMLVVDALAVLVLFMFLWRSPRPQAA